MKTIYMDNAATSYPKPEAVYNAINNFNRNLGGNPGRGSNQYTLKAGSIMLQTREALAGLFNISDSLRIAFTQNITEALNTGLKGILQPGDHVITTSMEHNAVARPLHVLANQGIEWSTVQCASDGSLNPQDIKKAIKSNTRLICMLHASNVCGTVMPISEIGKIAKDNHILFMVDTAQTAGILSIDVVRDNIDVLTFTGHKGMMGPQGTGGIYIGPDLIIKPLKEGGTGSLSEFLEQPQVMPDLLESGTPNTPGIAGLLAGVEFIAATGLETIRKHERSLTDQLLEGLKKIKRVTVYGPGDSAQQTAVVAFNIEGVDCGDVCMRLDYEYGIVIRSGLHCAPLAHKTMGTLELGACRLSPGFFTTNDEIDEVLKAVYNITK